MDGTTARKTWFQSSSLPASSMEKNVMVCVPRLSVKGAL